MEKKLVIFFVHYTNSKLLIDFAGVKIFDSATVDTNMQEYLSETIRAVANMISRNVLAPLPECKGYDTTLWCLSSFDGSADEVAYSSHAEERTCRRY